MSKKSKRDDCESSFFEETFSGGSKLWLIAVPIVFLLIAGALWVWFDNEDSSLKDSTNVLENKVNSFSNAYDAIKDRLLEEAASLENERSRSEGEKSFSQEAAKLPASPEVNQEQVFGAVERGGISKDWKASEGAAARADDDVVRGDFVDSMASRLIKGYRPSKVRGRPGAIDLSPQDINMLYGGHLTGFAWSGNDLQKSRAKILKYVFTPSMLESLYRLYIDRFMGAVEKNLSNPKGNKVFSLAQKQEFYRLYAREFRGASGVLQGITAMPNFTKRMRRAKEASQKVVDASNSYTNTIEQIETYGLNSSQAQLRLKVELAAQAYQKAILHREKELNGIVHAIKQNPAARILDDSSILYIAFWVERRVGEEPEKMDAVSQAATVFLDLAKRFETTSGTLSDDS